MLNDDMALVRAYAHGDSEAAFTELVARHVNLVYSVALRQVREPRLTEKVTQAVFIILARKAAMLGDRTVVAGWLCLIARYASADALKQQRRRQRRESEAYMQSASHEPAPDLWPLLVPLLDDGLAHLGERDHNAIVLRYLENKKTGRGRPRAGHQRRRRQNARQSRAGETAQILHQTRPHAFLRRHYRRRLG